MRDRSDTKALIRRLTLDLAAGKPRRVFRSVPVRLFFALAAASFIVLLILLTLFSRSQHLHHMGLTVVVTLGTALALATGSFAASVILSRPDTTLRPILFWVPASLVLAVGIASELAVVPPTQWFDRMVGVSPVACFVSVFVLSLPLLFGALWAIRQGATTRPHLAGAFAGLLAGAIAGGLYVLHCPEDSLLFVTAWHVPAVLLVAGVGAAAGRASLLW